MTTINFAFKTETAARRFYDIARQRVDVVDAANLHPAVNGWIVMCSFKNRGAACQGIRRTASAIAYQERS